MIAAVSCLAQGQVAARRSRRRRPPRTSRPAAENSRSRLGSQVRAAPSRASSWIQAGSSLAMATSSHQSWFWSKPCSGSVRILADHDGEPADLRVLEQGRPAWPAVADARPVAAQSQPQSSGCRHVLGSQRPVPGPAGRSGQPGQARSSFTQ